MRQMELEVARDAAMEVQKSHFAGVRVQPGHHTCSVCEHCVAHRAQPDRHERSDLSKESSISAVSSEL